MKKRIIVGSLLMIVVSVIGLFTINSSQSAASEARKPIFRLYNSNTGEHLFSPSYHETVTLVQLGWKDEGTAFYGLYNKTDLNENVKRVYNPNAGDHHYTTDDNEIFELIKVGWQSDNIGFYTANQDGKPVYRLYNPNAKAGAHHFTLDRNERDYLVKVGWKAEGVGFKAYEDLGEL